MVMAVAQPEASAVQPRTRGRWVRRVVRVARTTPGRLASTGVVLVVLALLAGVFGFVAVKERSDAAERVATRSEPLAVRTQELYRSLADADATAAAALLSGGIEKPALRDRYEQDMDSAQRTLMAASSAGATGNVAELLSRLSVEVPQYREDVARAKTETRQGHTVGPAWLRAASKQMQDVILVDAAALHEEAGKQLRRDHDRATGIPVAAMAAGALALAALVVAQVWLARRTKRVFNPGLLLACLSVAALLVWVSVGLSSARDRFTESRDGGWRPVEALSAARFAVLRARGDEGQILVQRGTDNGKYEADLNGEFADLSGSTGDPAPEKRLLGEAARLSAGDPVTLADIDKARGAVGDWQTAHDGVNVKYENVDYAGAVAEVIGDKGGSQTAFDRADGALADAIKKDQADFEKSVKQGRDELAGLGVGVVVLAVLAAVGIVDGMRRRLGEYR
ncbi:hypothetical protein GCM10023205_44520 [Yinghuangia aomiensis]|uniref:Secreted protein n=2 Tax=Yinghuangia aomiensis TaxID=676205 RepID=A0ABP9HKK2_9ACTN